MPRSLFTLTKKSVHLVSFIKFFLHYNKKYNNLKFNLARRRVNIEEGYAPVIEMRPRLPPPNPAIVENEEWYFIRHNN